MKILVHSSIFFFFFLDFWHEWVLNSSLAEKENQKVLFNPSKMSLFCFPPEVVGKKVIDSPCLLHDKTLKCHISRSEHVLA